MTERNYTFKDVLKYLPHRAPFLFVDKIISVDESTIHTSKLISINEPYFAGHFPGYPVMPGVLIVEAMAQSAGILMMHRLNDVPREENPFYLASIKQARFKQVVQPGDTLEMFVTLLKHKAAVWAFSGEAKVNGEVVATAEFINMAG